MELWRLHRLYDVDETSGVQTQIGGAIVDMKIGGVNGSLSEISVTPITKAEQEEFDTSSFVRMQVADRAVWMEPNEVQTLLELLSMALSHSLA